MSVYRLGNFYHQRGELKEAYACYQQVLEFFRSIDDIYDQVEVLTDMGQLYADLHMPDKANSIWMTALALAKDNNYLHHVKALGGLLEL